MAAGLPVVACRAASVPEIVEDRRTGLLVNPGSPDALATAMETLLMNEALRKELGAAGTRRVEAFDLERVAQRFVEILPRARTSRTAPAASPSPRPTATGSRSGRRRRKSAASAAAP